MHLIPQAIDFLLQLFPLCRLCRQLLLELTAHLFHECRHEAHYLRLDVVFRVCVLRVVARLQLHTLCMLWCLLSRRWRFQLLGNGWQSTASIWIRSVGNDAVHHALGTRGR